MKMLSWFFALILTVSVPLGALAEEEKKPAPFAPVDKVNKKVSVAERFDIMVRLPATSPARLLFFGEARRNTGLNEAELTSAVKSGATNVATVTVEGGLETAGIKNERAKYWRIVRKDEEIVFVKKGNDWVPWFLLRCNNPVRVVKVREEVKTPRLATPPPVSPPISPPPAMVVAQATQSCCPIPVQNVSATYTLLLGDGVYGVGTSANIIHNGVFYPTHQ